MTIFRDMGNASLTSLAHVPVHDGLSPEKDTTVLRGDSVGHRLYQGCLAVALHAGDPVDLTRADGEAHVVQLDSPLFITHRQSPDLQHVRSG